MSSLTFLLVTWTTIICQLWSKQFNSPHEDVRMDWLDYWDRFQWDNERDFRFVTKIHEAPEVIY